MSSLLSFDKLHCSLCRNPSSRENSSIADSISLLYNKNSEVIFFLRNLVGLNSEEVCDLFRIRCPQEEPWEWLNFCSSCRQVVESAKSIFIEIQALEKELGLKRGFVKNTLSQWIVKEEPEEPQFYPDDGYNGEWQISPEIFRETEQEDQGRNCQKVKVRKKARRRLNPRRKWDRPKKSFVRKPKVTETKTEGGDGSQFQSRQEPTIEKVEASTVDEYYQSMHIKGSYERNSFIINDEKEEEKTVVVKEEALELLDFEDYAKSLSSPVTNDNNENQIDSKSDGVIEDHERPLGLDLSSQSRYSTRLSVGTKKNIKELQKDPPVDSECEYNHSSPDVEDKDDDEYVPGFNISDDEDADEILEKEQEGTIQVEDAIPTSSNQTLKRKRQNPNSSKNPSGEKQKRVRRKRNVRIEFKCRFSNCSQSFPTSKERSTHHQSHKIGFPCTVEGCSQVIVTLKGMEMHLRCCHQPRSINTCAGCGQVFLFKSPAYTFNAHLKHSVEQNPHVERCNFFAISCPECTLVKSPTQEALDIHLQVLHGPSVIFTTPFKCPHCPKTFPTKVNLVRHEFSHFDADDRVIKCPYDGCTSTTKFRNKQDLNSHISGCHLEKKYRCAFEGCGKLFSRPNHRKRHEKLHYEQKPFLCSICGKTFKVRDYIYIHMRSHDPTRKKQKSTNLKEENDSNEVAETDSNNCVPNFMHNLPSKQNQLQDQAIYPTQDQPMMHYYNI